MTKKEGRLPVTVNLEDSILAWVDAYGAQTGLDRATCIRTLVYKGKIYVEETEGKWRSGKAAPEIIPSVPPVLKKKGA
jgi:hypothetical protein